MLRILMTQAAAALLALFVHSSAAAEEGIHYLALQLSDGDPAKMSAVLNVAANVSRHYTGIGDEIEIKIVVFDAGLHMVRTDTSPVPDRMKSFAQSMPNVTFLACGNTIDTMRRNENKEIPLFQGVEVVQTGVVALMELDREGYTIVRP